MTLNDKLEYSCCSVAVVWGLPKPLGFKKKKASKRQRLLNEISRVHKGEVIVLEAPVVGRRIVPKECKPWWVKTFFPSDAFWTHLLLPEELYLSDPYNHFRIGLGGFPDDGALALAPFAPRRWRTLKSVLNLPSPKPWRQSGSHIVVIGQVPGDASLRGLDISAWMYHTCVELRKLTDRPIVARPHPLCDEEVSKTLGVKLLSIGVIIDDISHPLSVTLEGAWAVVTYSSGAAVDAVLSGVPAVTMSTASFAWEVSDHTLESVINPSLPDREPWLEKLAASQWSEPEIKSGEIWELLLLAIDASRESRNALKQVERQHEEGVAV